MMTPLRCEGRGGDQERVSVRDVVEIVKFWGGPLGTVLYKVTAIKIVLLYSLLSCWVVTLVVAAGPPPTLV